MMLIFGLMLLLKTAACLEVNCSFNQSGPCYAAVGDKLRLNLLVVNTRNYDLKIQKIIGNTEKDPVCRVKDDRMKEGECDLFNNRPEVSFINGTLIIINPVIRADSGNYRLYLTGSDGTEIFRRDLQVIVEDRLIIPIVLGCVSVILILLVIMAYYFYKKKNQLKPTPHVTQKKLDRKEEQKSPDVEYVMTDSQKKDKRKGKENEVHYAEVTFSNFSVQQPRQTQEDCVYSELQKP